MAGELDKAMKDALGSLTENLQLVIDQLKDGENTRAEDPKFDATNFWGRFGLTFQAVSTEATKLTVAFSSSPSPDAQGTATLVNGMEKSALAMLSAFYSLPPSQGRTLHRIIHGTVLCILTSVQSLVGVIRAEGIDGSKRQLQSTGGVWEYCDSFAGLPKSNKDAVLKQSREQSDLVKDALEEIESAIDEDEEDECESGGGGGEEDRWSEGDRCLLAPSLGLLKASRSCLKKTTVSLKENAKCTDDSSINQLDEIADALARVSPGVDDFVLSLYPPLKPDNVMEESRSLSQVLLCLLNQLRSSHITSKADNKWLDFLTKAVKHNQEKLEQLLPE